MSCKFALEFMQTKLSEKSPKNIFDKGAEKVYNNVGFLREIGVFQELTLKNA